MNDAFNAGSRPGSAPKERPLSIRTWNTLTAMESGSWRLLNTGIGSSERIALNETRYRYLKRALVLKLRSLELEEGDGPTLSS
jgi:hypothetical protein